MKLILRLGVILGRIQSFGSIAMYIRFVSTFPDPKTGRPYGLFQAAYILRRDPQIPKFIIDAIGSELDWFDANLDEPLRLSKSRHHFANSIALSWFLPSAHECIDHARAMASMVSECTFAVDVKKTAKPGYVLYRDSNQIAAIPFRE